MRFTKITPYLHKLFLVIVVFIHCVNSITIDCDPISDTEYGRKYCFIRHLSANEFSQITIKTNPYADNKRELIFDNCTLTTLPMGLFENYPNLVTMYTWNAGIRTIAIDNFRNANHLSALDLTKNRIELLSAYVFSLAPNLKRLELSINFIKSIDVETFAGLTQLRTLHLDNNQIEFIPANALAPLIHLQTIRFNNNIIKAIAVELFINNIQLVNIYLNDNEIESLTGEQTFRHLTNVQAFDLHNNPIANLVCCIINAQMIDIRNTRARGCYVGTRTTKLHASNNQISFIEISNSSSNLVSVDLSNNKLIEMKNLTHLDRLTYLDLSKNQINDIGINSFANMRHLVTLNLQNSGLHTIFFGLFSHKPKLKLLDVSYNQLERIDFNMFMSLSSLRTLYLEGNNITDMDMTEIRTVFPALTKIGIAKNNWHCSNLALAVKYLESNGIELNSVGLIKNTENIKGIPCFNIINNPIVVAASINKEKSQIDITETTSSRPKIENSEDICHKQCRDRSSLTNLREAEFAIRLIELKYKAIDTFKTAKIISEQLQNILDLLLNK